MGDRYSRNFRHGRSTWCVLIFKTHIEGQRTVFSSGRCACDSVEAFLEWTPKIVYECTAEIEIIGQRLAGNSCRSKVDRLNLASELARLLLFGLGEFRLQRIDERLNERRI